MEWLLVGVGVLALMVLVGGRRGDAPTGHGGTVRSTGSPRGAAVAGAAAAVAGPGSARETVLGRALDPDAPDGAFMDGYLAGRYTERYATTHPGDRSGDDPPGSARAADSEEDEPAGGWDDEPHDPLDERSVDAWSGPAWSGPAWSDPTAQDVTWETGEADGLDDW